MKKVNILNLGIDNLSTAELIERLDLHGGMVFTPNVDHLIKLQKDREFVKAYNSADYTVCDSKILIYVSHFLGHPIKEKISGSDLFPKFCEYHANNPKSKLFLLGAAAGVAKKALRIINRQAGRNMVVDTYSPDFGFEKDEKECQKIVDLINNSSANVLVMGLGTPKQEKWIFKYRNQLKNVKIVLAVGAAIDFVAGNKKRAPQWMSHVGLEWLHRVLSEPRRLAKRYFIDDMPFFWLVLLQKFNLYSIPFCEQIKSEKQSGEIELSKMNDRLSTVLDKERNLQLHATAKRQFRD